MPPPALSNSLSLSEQLRRRTDVLQSTIVRTNFNTQFAQTASELTDFRLAVAGSVDEADDHTLSELFRRTAHLTTYDAYAPFVARFFEKPCKANAVVDLFAPGLPDYLVESSSTSGRLPKTFLKYNRLSQIRSSSVRSWTISDPLRRRTTAFMWYLALDRTDIEDDGCSATTVYTCNDSAAFKRMNLYLDPEKDEEKMGTFVLDHAAPYAAGFIKKWRPFLLIHTLFALGSRSLESMIMVFISTFVDMMRHLDTEFDMMMDCVANGTIPDLDGIAEVRHHLEANIVADPERAAELRQIGRPSSQPGWCGRVWPNLRLITSIASGSFASSVPLARWFLGPNANIQSPGYGTTECWIGPSYDPLELDYFKLTDQDVIELLDIDKGDSIAGILQLWEVEVGKRYELVLTTRDGLWRYRLGDVVEVSGFDPTDGVPIIRFIERINTVIRFPAFMVTEGELRATMSSLALSIPVNIVNWTAAIDNRCNPATIGFFIELADEQVPDLAWAPERLHDELSRSNANVVCGLTTGEFGRPTIRLVQAGTFSDFLQLKLDEGSKNNGQVKVPIVLPNTRYTTWFTNRVVQEL